MGLFGFGKTSVHISRSVYEEILRHAKEAYPNECCGVLVGANYGGERKIFESHRANNINTDRAHDRYIIDPKEFNLIDKMARSCSMDVMGFYHSHPDHPDKPSETDREWGQTGYSYIIEGARLQAGRLPRGRELLRRRGESADLPAPHRRGGRGRGRGAFIHSCLRVCQAAQGDWNMRPGKRRRDDAQVHL